MLARNQAEALQLIKGELNGLGYVGGLIQEDYDFAEVLLENVEVSQILLNQSQGEMRRWWRANGTAESFSRHGLDGFNGRTKPILITPRMHIPPWL